MHPHLNSVSSDAESMDKLSECQTTVRQCERITGLELDETFTTATQIEEAPPQLQAHPRLRSVEIGTDYKKVVVVIESCLRPKKSWGTRSQADTNIGATSTSNRQKPVHRTHGMEKR